MIMYPWLSKLTIVVNIVSPYFNHYCLTTLFNQPCGFPPSAIHPPGIPQDDTPFDTSIFDTEEKAPGSSGAVHVADWAAAAGDVWGDAPGFAWRFLAYWRCHPLVCLSEKYCSLYKENPIFVIHQLYHKVIMFLLVIKHELVIFSEYGHNAILVTVHGMVLPLHFLCFRLWTGLNHHWPFSLAFVSNQQNWSVWYPHIVDG